MLIALFRFLSMLTSYKNGSQSELLDDCHVVVLLLILSFVFLVPDSGSDGHDHKRGVNPPVSITQPQMIAVLYGKKKLSRMLRSCRKDENLKRVVIQMGKPHVFKCVLCTCEVFPAPQIFSSLSSQDPPLLVNCNIASKSNPHT